MSMGIGANANASVSADGTASAGASVGGGIGGTLAGALGGGLSAGLSVAGGLALSAAAGFAANASFGAGFSFGESGTAAPVGTRPPEILPAFKYRVKFQDLPIMRFQFFGPIKASMNQYKPPTKPAKDPKQKEPEKLASDLNAQAQGGLVGATTTLQGIGWTWTKLMLKRGVAKDGQPLLEWIREWWTNPQKDVNYKNLTVFMLDYEGKPALTWSFQKTFPVSWNLSEFRTDQEKGTLALETLELSWTGTPDLQIG